ncbi:MAG: nucleotidyl transferase AbiEii/AbiGii toxin family protein [Candidatus Hydrogenedentes bacterium]|nr:nucleotidyl transferase AbiEii/AbiGii toxin family protein [Candidatus Hydrogenedentota bacterium]
MTRKPVSNIAASIRQRLLNHAHGSGRPFNEVLQYYALERFLYRLAESSEGELFVLKGAMMLRARNAPDARPTMDIDLLGMTPNDTASLLARFEAVLRLAVLDDGLHFDPSTLRSEGITKEMGYDGVRLRFRGVLDTARVSLQVDIGFGDIVYPPPERHTMPTVLDQPAPDLLCYSLESAIAEKLEAAVKLGQLNSRIKDFYDIWLLSSNFDFRGDELAEAIRRTFQNRKTALERDLEAFGSEFCMAKSQQWTAFKRRLHDPNVPERLEDAMRLNERFLGPVLDGLLGDMPMPLVWRASGPWI